jgi:hypothetical protein
MERTPETFQAHLVNRVQRCGEFYIMLEANDIFGRESLIVPQMCSSNYCPDCRAKLLLQLRKALYRSMKGKQWRLITLTFAQRDVTNLQVLKALSKAFRRLSLRLKKDFPGIQYCRTIEVHQSGYPHIHMVVDRYIPIGWLQLQWNKVGGGIADIRSGKRKDGKRKPAGYKQAARYLTEEIEKAVQDPHRLGVDFWMARVRSISVSRGLSLTPPQSRWKFVERGLTPEDVSARYYQQTFSAKMNGLPTPNIVDLPNRMALIAVGAIQPLKDL